MEDTLIVGSDTEYSSGLVKTRHYISKNVEEINRKSKYIFDYYKKGGMPIEYQNFNYLKTLCKKNKFNKLTVDSFEEIKKYISTGNEYREWYEEFENSMLKDYYTNLVKQQFPELEIFNVMIHMSNENIDKYFKSEQYIKDRRQMAIEAQENIDKKVKVNMELDYFNEKEFKDDIDKAKKNLDNAFTIDDMEEIIETLYLDNKNHYIRDSSIQLDNFVFIEFRGCKKSLKVVFRKEWNGDITKTKYLKFSEDIGDIRRKIRYDIVFEILDQNSDKFSIKNMKFKYMRQYSSPNSYLKIKDLDYLRN